MTSIKAKIWELALIAKSALERGDFKTVRGCALQIAQLSETAEFYATPDLTECGCGVKKAEPETERFGAQITFDNLHCHKSGNERGRGYWRHDETINGKVNLEAEQPKGLTEALTKVFTEVLFNRNNKA